jgi:hypothetical protein
MAARSSRLLRSTREDALYLCEQTNRECEAHGYAAEDGWRALCGTYRGSVGERCVCVEDVQSVWDRQLISSSIDTQKTHSCDVTDHNFVNCKTSSNRF